METGALNWPEERVAGDGSAALFAHPGSNLCLDVHGDPGRAALVVFSDGNHHMALEETLRAFAGHHADMDGVVYATTPPRVLADWVRQGCVQIGNLRLTLGPHLFISPPAVLARLVAEGLVQPPRPFMRSRGFAFVVARGNPKRIAGVQDLLREDVRLFMSNPETEAASYQAYTDCLRLLAGHAGVRLGSRDDAPHAVWPVTPCYGATIHHREAPQAIVDGKADVAFVYYHLALRFRRIFPEHLEMLQADGMVDGDCANSRFHVSLVGDGGRWGARLADFLAGDEVARIYRAHGLERDREPAPA